MFCTRASNELPLTLIVSKVYCELRSGVNTVKLVLTATCIRRPPALTASPRVAPSFFPLFCYCIRRPLRNPATASHFRNENVYCIAFELVYNGQIVSPTASLNPIFHVSYLPDSSILVFFTLRYWNFILFTKSCIIIPPGNKRLKGADRTPIPPFDQVTNPVDSTPWQMTTGN